MLAGGGGVEPPQSEPESDVLPLDDPPTQSELNSGLPCSQGEERTSHRGYFGALLLLSTFPLTLPSPTWGEGF
jgi:hypothetical protein